MPRLDLVATASPRVKPESSALEQHYTPAEVAKLWRMSDDYIRDVFRDEPGVIKIDRPETMHKRGYRTLRIPESVVLRVGARLAA